MFGKISKTLLRTFKRKKSLEVIFRKALER